MRPFSGRARRSLPESSPLNTAVQKADVLIEACEWIRKFRDKITVIKLGGSVMEDENALRHLLLDILFMETVGMRPVVVHGGGANISREMEKAGLKPHFVQGRRYTDPATLEIVERALATETNEGLAKKMEELGGRAVPLNFRRNMNVLFGRKLALPGPDGKPLDLGFVGEVTNIDRSTIENFLVGRILPIIPSMCVDELGQKYNVNADTAATAVAVALGAEKLVFLSDINGVRRDKNDPDTVIRSLTVSEAQKLIDTGVVDAGMIPKLQACIEPIEKGIRKVHIIDGRERHSLLLEIYTSRGVGTEIYRG
ncbi:MAG: acetylglutamate kinase [Planctomycetaceae bacterium]|nr:acetylglutamate kinase [Planctomycetaceae bacterium]